MFLENTITERVGIMTKWIFQVVLNFIKGYMEAFLADIEAL